MEEMKVQKRAPEVIVAEIWTLNRSQLVNWIETGRKLCELKESVPYGEFGKWVKEAGYSTTKANNLMRLYTEFGAAQGNLFGTDMEDFQTYGKLQYSQAVALLDVPSEERAAFMAEHDVEDMSVRELQKAIRERDEAKAAAEAARSDVERLENLRAAEQADKARDAEIWERQANSLREKIKELENRPVDVAVQVDEEAVKKAADEARASAEAEWSAKVKEAEDKLAKAKEKAEKAEEKAKKAGEQTSGEVANLKAEAEQLRAELERAKREQAKASISGDADLAAFQLLFEAAQTDINKMRGLLLKVRGREDSELGEKLTAALLALAEKVKECAA